MAQIIEPGYAGTIQNNPLGVDAQSLYNAYDARRVEARNDQLAYAQKLDNDWNTMFMPAVVNMMHSSDPAVKKAAEDRYMQGVIAYANARQVRLSEDDLGALLTQFRARYSGEGNTNAELTYMGARTGVQDAQGSTAGGAGAGAKAAGGAGNAAPAAAKADPYHGAMIPAGGAAQPTSAPPDHGPMSPAKYYFEKNGTSGVAFNYPSSGSPLVYPASGNPMAYPLEVPQLLKDNPIAAKAPVVDETKKAQFIAQWTKSKFTPAELREFATRYRAQGLETEAQAAETVAGLKEKPQMDARRSSRQKREQFESTGVALTKTPAVIGEKEPELVIKASTVARDGADAAVQEALESKIVSNGQLVQDGAGFRQAQSVAGDTPTEPSGPLEPQTPEGPVSAIGIANRLTPPAGKPSAPTSLPAPLVKAQARISKSTEPLAQKAQSLWDAAQSATSPAASQRAVKQSYLCLDRLARVVSNTPEFKQTSADTFKKWNLWVKTATPEELAAAGLKDVSDARASSLDRASREKIAFAQIQAQKEIQSMQNALMSEQTKRTASQVLESIYKSGIEDIVVKKYGGDVASARKKSTEVENFYRLSDALMGNMPQKWVKDGSGFLGLGKHKEYLDPDNAEDKQQLINLARGLDMLNSEVTRTKAGARVSGNDISGSTSGTGNTAPAGYSPEDVTAALYRLQGRH